MTRLAVYVLRNSGPRVWLADRLVALAGRLNPARPWARTPASVYVTPGSVTVRVPAPEPAGQSISRALDRARDGRGDQP